MNLLFIFGLYPPLLGSRYSGPSSSSRNLISFSAYETLFYCSFVESLEFFCFCFAPGFILLALDRAFAAWAAKLISAVFITEDYFCKAADMRGLVDS